MAINTLLKLNGVEYTTKILTPFTVNRKKRMADDLGEVMSGEIKGTLVGTFTSLDVIFYPKNEIELSELLVTLDLAEQEVEYYDAKTRTLVALETFTGDTTYQYRSTTHYAISPISVTFFARKREFLDV